MTSPPKMAMGHQSATFGTPSLSPPPPVSSFLTRVCVTGAQGFSEILSDPRNRRGLRILTIFPLFFLDFSIFQTRTEYENSAKEKGGTRGGRERERKECCVKEEITEPTFLSCFHLLRMLQLVDDRFSKID